LVIRVIVVGSLEVLDDDPVLLCVVTHRRLILCEFSDVPVAVRLTHSTDQKFTRLFQILEKVRRIEVCRSEEVRDVVLKRAVHASIVVQLRSDVKSERGDNITDKFSSLVQKIKVHIVLIV